jgi:hypothetical protein
MRWWGHWGLSIVGSWRGTRLEGWGYIKGLAVIEWLGYDLLGT